MFYFLGQGWQEEGLAVRLAELSGFASGGEARTAVALARMMGILELLIWQQA